MKSPGQRVSGEKPTLRRHQLERVGQKLKLELNWKKELVVGRGRAHDKANLLKPGFLADRKYTVFLKSALGVGLALTNAGIAHGKPQHPFQL